MFRYIILCLIVLPLWSFGQEGITSKSIGSQEDARFRASLLGGVNVSQIDGDNLAGFNKIGLNAGAQVNIILDRKDWVGNFQPSIGINFSQMGSAPGGADGQAFIYQRLKLDYAQIPLLVNYIDGRVVFSAGFAYGRLVNTTFIDTNGLDVTVAESPNYRKGDVTFIGGGTFYLTQHIGLNINWERSLPSVNKLRWQVNRLISFKTVYTF